MKYVKLFEDFSEKIKYDLVKPLPVSADMTKHFINTADIDKLTAIKGELEKLGLENRGNLAKETINTNIKIRDFFEDARSIIWSNVAFYSNTKDYAESTEHYQGGLNFDEYFKLKPEYRGHNLKKFGV